MRTDSDVKRDVEEEIRYDPDADEYEFSAIYKRQEELR